MPRSDTETKVRILKLIDACESDNATASGVAQLALQTLIKDVGGDEYDRLMDEIEAELKGLGQISLDTAIKVIQNTG